MDPTWYLKRLASMGPAEIVHRTEDAARRRLWRRRPPPPPDRRPVGAAGPALVVPPGLMDAVDPSAAGAVVAAADELLAGRWTMFGRPRTDMTAEIDWFTDFVSGARAPADRFSLSIDHRDEGAVGNIKYVWEPARHQHLTVLASAFAVSGDERYAERIDRELRNYWSANPFLTGIHWTSGIELGIRLVSWTWIRRLLDPWPGVRALFEDNPAFVDQLGRHHQWIAALGSHGSSANNHVIAEAVGQFVATTAFPLFDHSATWRAQAAEELATELDRQTFPDGLNRELASDYHGFVLELGLVAWLEAVLSGHPASSRLSVPLTRAFDALQAVVDVAGKPHRQGDSDDANGWLLDPIDVDRWTSLRRTAALIVEPAPWWPPAPGVDVRTAVVERCLEGRHDPVPRPHRATVRPGLFPDAGLSVLRADADPERDLPELWCCFDHGPHGYLSTAAHAHADALAVEIRCGGVEVVVDPGTYCYHGERVLRDHFRSTRAHATVTLGGVDQSDIAGPFLWTRKAGAVLEGHQGLDGGGASGDVALVEASHDGYRPLGAVHRRRVRLDRRARTVTLSDRIESIGADPFDPVPVEVVLPFGPTISVELDRDRSVAELSWNAGDGEGGGRASVTLDAGLTWSVVRGAESPPAGWYSAHFGTRVPATSLIGRSPAAGPGAAYETSITFLPLPPGGS